MSCCQTTSIELVVLVIVCVSVEEGRGGHLRVRYEKGPREAFLRNVLDLFFVKMKCFGTLWHILRKNSSGRTLK